VDTTVATVPDPPRVSPTDENADTLLKQCSGSDRLGDIGNLKVDSTFISGDHVFYVVTADEGTCHTIYLLAVQFDAIERCAILEWNCEQTPGAAFSQYKDLQDVGDTVFKLTLVTQAITDSTLLDNQGRLKPGVSLDSVPKVEVRGVLLPSMLLNDTVPKWPAVWRANPPFVSSSYQ
jgi:hypothetical protein